MKYLLLLISITLFLPCIVHADSADVGNTYKKISCGDASYLEIENETFKQDTLVSCEKISDDTGFAPSYHIDIKQGDIPIHFTRKEIKLHIPISLLRSDTNNVTNLSLYFFDDNIKNWVIMSSDVISGEIVGKIIHTGNITIYEKQFTSSMLDIYSIIAWAVLVIGIIGILIYNKYMNKKFLLILLFCLVFIGCSNNKQIDEYNNISQEHNDEAIIAFGHLSESLNLFNQKKYDDAIASADQCIVSYEKTKAFSKQGKDLAKSAKLASWIQEYKDVSIQSEDIRIEQCQLLKSVSTEAKKLNPDTEIVAKTINEIADYNTKFNALETTLNDMKNQHGNNFK